MSFGTATATPVPMPQGLDSDEAEKKRLDAERAALAESKGAGRRSTIAGGAVIAADEQQARGARKRAARESLGY